MKTELRRIETWTYPEIVTESAKRFGRKRESQPMDVDIAALTTARQAELDIARRQREAAEALKQGDLFA